MNNVEQQISRMKAMMTYGLKTESKKNQYSDVEYHKTGADGKLYGIVREGTKFYIKVSNTPSNPIKENFDYIGGFRNRKDYEYHSYASALKNFEMKLNSINEAYGSKEPLIESWNLDKKEELALESTDKMKKEIKRQRQIMHNSSIISEKKNYEADLSCVNKECADTQKNNIKKECNGNGCQLGNGGDPFTKKAQKKQKNSQKTNVKKEFKPVTEGEEVLTWNDNKDYLDTSKGTEIGDDAPFNENACKNEENCTVDEGVSMHSTDNQNKPEVGVGEIGDDAPFTKTVKESEIPDDDLIDVDYETDDSDSDIDLDDTEDDFDNEDDYSEDDLTDDDSDMDLDDTEDDFESDDTNERLTAIEDIINKIAEKLGVDIFDDDKLYDDTEDDFGNEDDYSENNFDDDDGYSENDLDDEDYDVYESINYRKLMKEDQLNYFGKHPAYQKKPMSIDNSNHQEMDGYYDMNDDSVKNNRPFGMEIGDGEPFEVDPNDIENAITESIKKILKKK